MNINEHPWNVIHRTGKYPDKELAPGFFEAVRLFRAHDCRFVLDMGCGSGRYTVALEREGFQVVGVDLSLAGLAITREKLAAEQRTAQLAIANFHFPLPFASAAFDAVFSTQVIHHARLAQVRLAIAEVWRVLAPEGLIFISVGGQHDRETPVSTEVEPGTFIPLEGQEAGVPHHSFTLEEAGLEFGRFRLFDVSVRAEGRVILVQGRKE